MIKKILLIILLSLLLPQDEVCEELPVDIWLRVSNDENNVGNIMKLDMSHGWSGCDGFNVYISVMDLNTGSPVMLVFPLNDWFQMDYSKYIPPKPKSEEEKPFDLDEYLKNNAHKGTKIQKILK